MLKKLLKLSFLTVSLAVLFILVGRPALAFCTEPSPIGDYTVSASCSFAGTTDGVESGNITIAAGQTLTIDASQTVIWNTGYSVTIADTGSILNDLGGTSSLTQDTLWTVDEDGDGLSLDLVWYSNANKPAGAVRVNTLSSRTVVDDCDPIGGCYSYAYSQGYYYGYGQGYYYAYGQGYYYTYGQGYYYAYGQSGYYSGCFPADTKVLMANGSYRNIAEIKAGDLILSYNQETGTTIANKVNRLIIHPLLLGQELLLINNSLRVTGNHNLWVESANSWLRADEVKVNDTLMGPNGQPVKVTSLQNLGPVTMPVYNLSIDGAEHNFFTDNILVHNIWKN